MRAGATQAILRGALEAFTKRGFHDATTAEIAERAGVSKGLIYSYFSSKEELLKATIEQRLGVVLEQISRIPPELPPRERLRQLVGRMVDLAVRDREAMRLYLLLLLQPGAPPAIRAATATLNADLERYYGALRSTLEALGHPQPVAAALALHSSLNGILLNLAVQPELLHYPEKYPLDEILDLLVDTFASQHR